MDARPSALTLDGNEAGAVEWRGTGEIGTHGSSRGSGESKMRCILITIALLTPIMLFSSCSQRQDAQISATDGTIQAIRIACEVYKLDTGAYPPPALFPDCLVSNPPVAGWKGPYVLVRGNTILKDGWGQDFRYVVEGTNLTITSTGRDGRFGTEDDQDGRYKPPRTSGCSMMW